MRRLVNIHKTKACRIPQPILRQAGEDGMISSDTLKKVRTTAAVVRTKGLLQAKALVEPVNPSTSVNQLLLAGIEGVALGADLNTNVLLGGASRKDVATRTADRGLFILGMDTFLHFVHLFLIR